MPLQEGKAACCQGSKGAAKAAERRSKAGMGRVGLQGAPGQVCDPRSPPVLTPAGTCWAQPQASSPIRVAGRAQPFTHSPARFLALASVTFCQVAPYLSPMEASFQDSRPTQPSALDISRPTVTTAQARQVILCPPSALAA